MRKKCGNWILRFRGEGSNPLPGVFQNPGPSVPRPPTATPRPSPALTSRPAGWGEAALGSGLGSAGGSGAAAGPRRRLRTLLRNRGRRSARALRTQPRGGERVHRGELRGGSRFRVWFGGVCIGTPGEAGSVGPWAGPRGQAPGLRPRRDAPSMCQRRRGSGQPVPAGRLWESDGPASRPAGLAASSHRLPFLWLQTCVGGGLPPVPVRFSPPAAPLAP